MYVNLLCGVKIRLKSYLIDRESQERINVRCTAESSQLLLGDRHSRIYCKENTLK